MTGNADTMNDDAFEQGRVVLPKRMNFRKLPQIYFADFGPLFRAFFGRFSDEYVQHNFPKRRQGDQRPFGFFRKIIRFGTAICPLNIPDEQRNSIHDIEGQRMTTWRAFAVLVMFYVAYLFVSYVENTVLKNSKMLSSASLFAIFWLPFTQG